MNAGLDPIKNWFGFTRRERRSTFILLIIIAGLIGFRYAVPDSKVQLKDITGDISAAEILSLIPASDNSTPITSYQKENRILQDTGKKHTDKSKTSIPMRNKVYHDYKPGQNTGKRSKPLIDINSGDSATLVTLPGIGPVLSARIIKYRRFLGGYSNIDQLKEVYGLSPETYELIRNMVFADSTFLKKISINTAAYKEIARVPYLEKFEVTAILKYRELKGRINSIDDLTDNKLITIEKGKKVAPYLRFAE